jgi:flagellar biosynthetic protein FliP
VRFLHLITAARLRRAATLLVALAPLAFVAFLWCSTPGASAQTIDPTNPLTSAPATPPTTAPNDGRVSVDVDLGNLGEDNPKDAQGKPSKTIGILVGLTVLAIAPSLIVLMTSFTRMVVVLGLARNAVGLQTVPPNQVITGLAVFLSLFVMAPTIKHINYDAWLPYLKGSISQCQAIN